MRGAPAGHPSGPQSSNPSGERASGVGDRGGGQLTPMNM